MLEIEDVTIEESKMAGAYLWRVAGILVCAIAIGITAVWATKAHAEPAFQAKNGDITLILHTEKCELPEVSNLPRRATWIEGSKVFEGCWGVNQEQRVVLVYFTDKTVSAIPVQVFSKVTGA